MLCVTVHQTWTACNVSNQLYFFHICSPLDTTHSKGFDHSLLVSCHLLVIPDLLAPTTLAYAVANTCAATTYGCCPDGKTPAAGPHQAGCPGKELANTKWYNFIREGSWMVHTFYVIRYSTSKCFQLYLVKSRQSWSRGLEVIGNGKHWIYHVNGSTF